MGENKSLKKIYDVLFAAEGSEIYLKPASHYVAPGKQASFYEVLMAAALLGETAIGYRQMAHSEDANPKFGVVIKPTKDQQFQLSEHDFVITLSED